MLLPKVTNHIRLWDIEFAWYSLSATHIICLYEWEYSLEIYGFKFTWPCLITEISWTIWLIYYDKLWLHLSHKILFLVAPTALCKVQIRKP